MLRLVPLQHLAMARGLSREQSAEKNAKAKLGQNKGNQEGISAAARAERDGAKLREKQLANEAKKAEMLASGQGDAVAKQEALKAAQREAKKERALTSTQNYKSMARAGALDASNRSLDIGGPSGVPGSSGKEKKELTPEEKRKKAAAKAAAAAAAAAGAAPPKKKGKEAEVATVAEEEEEVQPVVEASADASAEAAEEVKSAEPVAMDVSDPFDVKEPEISEEVKAERRAAEVAKAKADAAREEEEAAAKAAKADEEECALASKLVQAGISKGTVKAVSAADFDVLVKAAY